MRSRKRLGVRPARLNFGRGLGVLVVATAVAVFLGTYAAISQTAKPPFRPPIRFGPRTVLPSETGLIFGVPDGFPWLDVGAYVGTPLSGNFQHMSAAALKIHHGRFQHFMPADDNNYGGYAYFPYSELKRFEAAEVAAGRPPIFITATYEGRRRPVYFAWSLGLNGNTPTAAPKMWEQAVDVSSDAYVSFWVTQYVRDRIFGDSSAPPNSWVGLDNCAFIYSLYGVIDDAGNFVSGVPWDDPFPKTAQQYLPFIETFFSKLRRVAPDVQTMCNVGSLQTPSSFPAVYADIPGLMSENIVSSDPGVYARIGINQQISWFSWFGSQGRVAVLRAELASNGPESVKTATLMYLLVRGPNFFFAPQYVVNGTAEGPSPVEYNSIIAQLGDPIEDVQVVPGFSRSSPYDLYSRRFQRGTVYANWTGASVTVPLSPREVHLNASNSPITELTIPDLSADYVLEPTEESLRARPH